MSDIARAFAPATVANVACGFDVLGFSVAAPGDEVIAVPSDEAGVVLEAIEGDDGRLPRDPEANTASVAAQAVVARVTEERSEPVGVTIRLNKGMPLSSGLGSSAASAVAAAIAVDAVLDGGLDEETLLECAVAGEAIASGARHADNVAPSLLGGIVLVRAFARPDVVRLPVPAGLTCALVRPHVEVRTAEARGRIGEWVALTAATQQWANVGALVAALYRSDLELLSRSLHDSIAEPVRADQVPGFHQIRRAAIEAGALGCSLSGSGPSVFALCSETDIGERVADAMADALAETTNLACDRYVSAVGCPGARVLDDAADTA